MGLTLIAEIGVVDRPSCRDIEVIDKVGPAFELYLTGGSIGTGGDIPAIIKDLDHDGKLEVLIDVGLGTIPQRCTAHWTGIFAWTGSNYMNVSDHFKGFYRRRLEFLHKIIPTLQPVVGATDHASRDKECLEAEEATIERFFGRLLRYWNRPGDPSGSQQG
jgi:hypothetical protein